MPRDNRFTIYDVLEKIGYFDQNPANSYARSKTDGANLYKGPVPYPRMLYHPEGEERITVPAEEIQTPFGPKAVGEQRELIWQIVDSAEAEAPLLAEGWHKHPAQAIRVRVELYIARLTAEGKLDERTKKKLLASIPQMSSDQRIRDLEAELARLTAQMTAEKELMAPTRPQVAAAAEEE